MTSFRHYSEKRSFIRMKVENKVSFVVEGSHQRHEGICIDISGAGMLIETTKKLKTGSHLTITVPSPSHEFSNLSARAAVIRVTQVPEQQKFQVGVATLEVLS